MKNFEERLERLEQLAEQIRDTALPLEEAVTVFEEGIKLSRSLEKDMGKLEGRVEILLNQPAIPDGKPELGLFDQEVN